MKKLTIFIFGFAMITLFSSFFSLFFGSQMTPGTKMAHKISGEIGRKLKTKYGLHFMGISEEGPDGRYKRIGLELSYDKILTRDEGRVLLLNCAKDTIDAFNSYPQFRQYMANVPFTGNNIILNIYIQPPNISKVYYPDILVFSFYNDKLEYCTKIPEMRFQYYTDEEETYDEAMKIVEEQRNGNRPFLGKGP